MKHEQKIKLSKIIQDFSDFLEKEYSSKFKYLSSKEDRHLFFLAGILTRLKQIQEKNISEKIIEFPLIQSHPAN